MIKVEVDREKLASYKHNVRKEAGRLSAAAVSKMTPAAQKIKEVAASKIDGLRKKLIAKLSS